MVMHDAQSVGSRASVAPIAPTTAATLNTQNRGVYRAIGSDIVRGTVAVTQYHSEVLSWLGKMAVCTCLGVWRGLLPWVDFANKSFAWWDGGVRYELCATHIAVPACGSLLAIPTAMLS